jgi:hypothetical protein
VISIQSSPDKQLLLVEKEPSPNIQVRFKSSSSSKTSASNLIGEQNHDQSNFLEELFETLGRELFFLSPTSKTP